MNYYIYSLGCKVNSYETSAVASLLRERGYLYNTINPDVIIINTCAVTATASQKSRQHIRKFRKQFPNSIIVVMGCFVQELQEKLKNCCDFDIAVGTSHRNEIPSLIEEYNKNNKQILMVDSDPRKYSCYENLGTASYSENVRAYLKIQDGCDNFCSYCLIPFVRGKSRSRKLNDIISEATMLVNAGYKEIIVSGIDIGSYGKDTNECNFSSLIEKLLDIPNLMRLRISSIEASQIDDKLIDLFKNRTNLANHIHIPLQSGAKNVLKMMNRKYEKELFLNKIESLRKASKNICITTDVIVGFPTETNLDFQETVSFIKACNFNMLHVFPYSARSGTSASKFKNIVTNEEKKERSKILLSLSKELWNNYCNQCLHSKQTVLIEEYIESKGLYYGHTSNYLDVYLSYNDNVIGKFIDIEYKNADIIK